MGINGLWKAISDTGKPVSLSYMSSTHLIDTRMKLRLGVDMSPLMTECLMSGQGLRISGTGVNGALLTLFYKLCAYLKSPVTLVFVYDGAQRPDMKRNVHVRTQKLMWVEPSKQLIRHFGFHVLEAPGEAEAELARLNLHGLIDGVLTSDSDVFVFGAQTVYRMIPFADRTVPDELVMFRSAKLEADLSLSLGGFLLFALVSGGDYNQGISNCGPAFAAGLSRCGFGNQLLHACNTITDNGALEVFLQQWRQSIRKELLTNSSGHLPYPSARIATQITDDFPHWATLSYYRSPVTSFAENSEQVLATAASWTSREPYLPGISEFAMQYFGCLTQEDILLKFKSVLWDGVFLQMLYSPLGLYNPSNSIFRTPFKSAVIIQAVTKKRKGKFASEIVGGDAPGPPQARLRVSINNFIDLLGIKIQKTVTADVWAHVGLVPNGILPNSNGSLSSGRPSIHANGSSTRHIIDLTLDDSNSD